MKGGLTMIEVRRYHSQIEEIFHEGGTAPARTLLRGSVAVVIANPFAGRHEPDLMAFMDALQPLGLEMAERLAGLMGARAGETESYGKGGIVGTAGEVEHGHVWHVPGGYAMRNLLEKRGIATKAIVPSNTKLGPPGTRIDVPLTHVNASYVRSHFDTMELYVPGAPGRDEIVFFLAMTTGARIHARVGGLRKEDIKGLDGLR
jgi:hypothetical protein